VVEIEERLKDRRVERKVHLTADMRTRWSNVEGVLDGVRSAAVRGNCQSCVSGHPGAVAQAVALESIACVAFVESVWLEPACRIE
jgi:hypothetical protein